MMNGIETSFVAKNSRMFELYWKGLLRIIECNINRLLKEPDYSANRFAFLNIPRLGENPSIDGLLVQAGIGDENGMEGNMMKIYDRLSAIITSYSTQEI